MDEATKKAPESRQKMTKFCLRLRSLFNLHNQARVISLCLALFSFALLANVAMDHMRLENFELIALGMCVASFSLLLLGSVATVPLFYLPSLYVVRPLLVKLLIYNVGSAALTLPLISTFSIESTFRSRASAMIYLNRQHTNIHHCLRCLINAFIFTLLFGALQVSIVADYRRLRSRSVPLLGWNRFGRLFRRRRQQSLVVGGKTIADAPMSRDEKAPFESGRTSTTFGASDEKELPRLELEVDRVRYLNAVQLANEAAANRDVQNGGGDKKQVPPQPPPPQMPQQFGKFTVEPVRLFV